jgi:predicted ATPase with chaperone activity
MAMPNYLKMTDAELAYELRTIENVMRNRINAVQPGSDTFGIIKGHEMAKRALLIAVAGNHSILFVGPKGVGKSMLRAAGLEFSYHKSFEALTCPCGFSHDPCNECHCTPAKIKRVREKWPHTDIWMEVPRVPEREMQSKLNGTGNAHFQGQLERIAHFTDLTLDQHSSNLLKCAVSELGLTPDERDTVVRVARTIANLDEYKEIRVEHLSEALNYRMPRV